MATIIQVIKYTCHVYESQNDGFRFWTNENEYFLYNLFMVFAASSEKITLTTPIVTKSITKTQSSFLDREPMSVQKEFAINLVYSMVDELNLLEALE